MKKLLFLVLTLLFSLGLVACGDDTAVLDEITGVKDGIEALEESLGADIDEITDLIEGLRDDLDAAEATIAQLNTLITELQADTNANTDAIEDLQDDLAAAEAALLARVEDLVADLLETNGKVNDAELAIAELTELLYMYIEFNDFEVETLSAPITEYFVELPNKSPKNATYEINWSSESSRFIFRDALVYDVIEAEDEEEADEIVERTAFGAVILPHRTTEQNLTITATFKSGEFEFTKDFNVVLPISGYDSYSNVSSALITSNNRVHSFIGVVAGTFVNDQEQEFYMIVDVDGRVDEEGNALPNRFKRVLIEENTPELEVGDEVYMVGRNTRVGTNRYFSPLMHNVYFTDTVTEESVYVLSHDNEVNLETQVILASEFTNLPNTSAQSNYGRQYYVSGQLYKSVEERFLTGAVDGDPLYDTDVYFLEFNDQKLEFYGLTAEQKTAFDLLDGSFVTVPLFYADYEIMFGQNLTRAQYVGDGSDIEVLTAQDMMDKVEDLFERVIPTEYDSTKDQNFILPVGKKWDATDENIEYLDVAWTTDQPDYATFSAARGVQIAAPFTEETITVTANIKVYDYETSTEENPVFITKTLSYTFTLKTNMVHWDDLSITGYTVADIDWLPGMLLADEDAYWDTWTYPRKSNQDNINKLIDGDRTEIFGIEVEARTNGFNDYVVVDITLEQAETINSVLVDSGVTGNDKIRGYEVYVWNATTQEWVMVFAITNIPNNSLSYHQATFDAVETNQVRIRITDSDQKYWGCCYTVRLSEVQIFKAQA